MDTTQELTHISLCTGYGGIDLGLGRALGAVRSIAYVEIEAFPVINLVKKIEAGLMDSAPIFTDLKAFPWGLYRHKVDILSGGFPCQPFSTCGPRAADKDPRHLWPYIVRGIKELGRPPFVFFENVEGVISTRLKGDIWSDPEKTPVLLHVLRELERLGYYSTAGIFSAAEVGAPHQRRRVFILGARNDLRESGFKLVNEMLGGKKLGNSDNNSRNSKRAIIHKSRRYVERRRTSISREWDTQNHDSSDASWSGRTAYPKGRGNKQFCWEPSRTVEHPNSKFRNKGHRSQSRIVHQESGGGQRHRLNRSINHPQSTRSSEPSMGGDIDGSSYWLDYAELLKSSESRVDELRMLGNGVVPDTAERAFKVLFERLQIRSSAQ